jgi:hypothetical protein
VALKATKWATVSEIRAALAAWPRSTPSDVWVRQIMAQTGLSEATCKLALDLARGDSIGDVVEVAD